MNVIDTFLFAGERDLLEVRLRELDGVVDRHVALAGVRTFRGQPTELDPAYSFCMTHHLSIVRVLTQSHDPFKRECEQRSFANALGGDSDLILHGDIDEIPRRSDLERAIAAYASPIRLRGDLHQHRLDWRLEPLDGLPHPDVAAHPFAGPVLASFGHTHDAGGVLNLRRDTSLPEMHRAGWHLQWCMTPIECVQKMRAGHHDIGGWFLQEEFWAGLAEYGTDPMGRWRLTRVDVDDTFPVAVREDPERWEHLMGDRVSV